MIDNNDGLRCAVCDALRESGIKKTFVADKLGITRQGLEKMLNKKGFTIDDANNILSLIGKKIVCEIVSRETF